MKIENINYKQLFALTLAGTILLTTGCQKKTDLEKALSHDAYKHSTEESYLDITSKKDGETLYFINKKDINDAIPDTYYLYDLGLKVDEFGNIVVIGPNDIKNSDVDCVLEKCQKDRYGHVEIGPPDDAIRWLDSDYSVEVVSGHRVYDEDGSYYDLKDKDIEKEFSDKGFFDNEICFESNEYGGADKVRYH